MGTSAFTVPALERLLALGHEVVAVYTQPPRPAGRGHGLQPTPMQLAAEGLGLPVETPPTLRDPDAVERLRASAGTQFDPDVVEAFQKYYLEVLIPELSSGTDGDAQSTALSTLSGD